MLFCALTLRWQVLESAAPSMTACCCWWCVLLLVQRAHELVGRELPVVVAEVLPDEHCIRFNCIAAVAAQRAALQPADLINGVVTEVGALARGCCSCWGCGVCSATDVLCSPYTAQEMLPANSSKTVTTS
jgi:hypothetical protein